MHAEYAQLLVPRQMTWTAQAKNSTKACLPPVLCLNCTCVSPGIHPSSTFWGKDIAVPALIAPDRYGSLERSAYSMRLGVLRVPVTRNPRLSSSASIFCSTSGCCEMKYLRTAAHDSPQGPATFALTQHSPRQSWHEQNYAHNAPATCMLA